LREERGNNEREKKFASRKIYIDNDLAQKERDVQEKLREIAREERANEKRARVEYRRIEIEGQIYGAKKRIELKRKNF